jgi:hypothetical protein
MIELYASDLQYTSYNYPVLSLPLGPRLQRMKNSYYTAPALGNLLKRKWTEQEYCKFITAEYVVDD